MLRIYHVAALLAASIAAPGATLRLQSTDQRIANIERRLD